MMLVSLFMKFRQLVQHFSGERGTHKHVFHNVITYFHNVITLKRSYCSDFRRNKQLTALVSKDFNGIASVARESRRSWTKFH